MLGCIRGDVVQVLRSTTGFYLGTFDEETGPQCRVSDYYKTYEDANRALWSRDFSIRRCAENLYCSGGRGCQLRMLS